LTGAGGRADETHNHFGFWILDFGLLNGRISYGVRQGSKPKTGWRLGEGAIEGRQHLWPQTSEKGVRLAGDVKASGGGGMGWVKDDDWHWVLGDWVLGIG
jgi:hypothetical protein